MTQEEVIQAWYDWWISEGGYDDPPNNFSTTIRGLSPKILESMASPYTEEIVVGATKRLGTRGVLRVDLVNRSGNSFYIERNIPGRQVDGPSAPIDLTTIENDAGFYSRDYLGLHTNFQYRAGDRWDFGVSYTLSKAEGNFDGETSNSGPVQGSWNEYTEYRVEDWNQPTGYLEVDQRHKLRAFAVWEAISTPMHSLSLSWLENFWTGANYSLDASVEIDEDWVTNPGYESPPDSLTYYFGGRRTDYFGGRRTEHFDNAHRSDISANYGFTFKGVEFFLQADMLNVFNEGAQISGDDTINILEDFNPYTHTPVEGVDWERDEDFGTADSENDFQQPRLYRFSVGVRF